MAFIPECCLYVVGHNTKTSTEIGDPNQKPVNPGADLDMGVTDPCRTSQVIAQAFQFVASQALRLRVALCVVRLPS